MHGRNLTAGLFPLPLLSKSSFQHTHPKGCEQMSARKSRGHSCTDPGAGLTHSGGRGFGNQRAEAVEHEMQAELQHLQQGGRKEIFFGLKSVTEQNINTVRQLS